MPARGRVRTTLNGLTGIYGSEGWGFESLRARLGQWGSRAQSVGASLKLPRCFEGILNGASVSSGEVSDHHHVFDVSRRDTEGSGKLPQYRVAVIEIGTDHHMHVVQLACDQPAVVPPRGQPFWRGAAHTRQALGQAGYIVDVHLRGLPWFSLVTITGSQLRLCDQRAITSDAGKVNARLLASAVLAAFWPHNGAQCRHLLRIAEQHYTSSSGVWAGSGRGRISLRIRC